MTGVEQKADLFSHIQYRLAQRARSVIPETDSRVWFQILPISLFAGAKSATTECVRSSKNSSACKRGVKSSFDVSPNLILQHIG
jgi:hypothetical protein